MPLPTLAFQVTPAGISAPTYDEIKQSLEETFQAIYGSDVYLAPDSQDGQLLAAFASAFNDMNNAAIALYQSFSPTYAQGAGLSSLVKINGIERHTSSSSTAVGNVVGVGGTVITNGVVSDNNGNKWNLPATVTIPGGGTIAVTVTAQQEGAVAAGIGTINKIATPTFGWQSFANTTPAVPGEPVETDAALRARQTTAAALPSNTPLGGTVAALEDLPGVTRVAGYENTTGGVDANGLPAHSISLVVEGGDVLQIATTIGQKKTPGAATFGNTAEAYTDPNTHLPYTINFYVLAYQAVTVEISVKTGAAWNSIIQAELQQAISDYVNSLGIGSTIQLSRIYTPAYLNGADDGKAYEIMALTVDGGSVDVVIPFNKAPSMDPSNVVVTVLP